MAKLPKLQWLPMLLEAYNEARTKSGLKPVTPGELLNGVIKEAPVKTKKKETKDEFSPAASKPTTKTVLRPAARIKTKPPINRHRNVGIKSKQGAQFHSVLRELRKTSQKLAQVENLQTQLNQLQSTVERQLTELNQRLGEHNKTDGKSSGKPDANVKSLSQTSSQPGSQTNPQPLNSGNTFTSGQASLITPPMASQNAPKQE